MEITAASYKDLQESMDLAKRHKNMSKKQWAIHTLKFLMVLFSLPLTYAFALIIMCAFLNAGSQRFKTPERV
jgi:hypothetical protein